MEHNKKLHLHISSDDANELYNRAVYLHQVGAYFAAEGVLEKALELSRENKNLTIKLLILLSKTYRGINSQITSFKELNKTINNMKELYNVIPYNYDVVSELGNLHYDLAVTMFKISTSILKDEYFLFYIENKSHNTNEIEKYSEKLEREIIKSERILRIALKYYTQAFQIRPLKSDAKFRIESVNNMFKQCQEFRYKARQVFKKQFAD